MELQKIIEVVKEYRSKYEGHNIGFNTLYNMLLEYKEEHITSSNKKFSEMKNSDK